MQRYLDSAVRTDLGRKMVFLTGPRQVGKTTLAKALMAEYPRAQYLNWDVANDRRMLIGQTWSPRAGLVILDEIHKMRDWKAYLKGVFDGRSGGQAILVTGSARPTPSASQANRWRDATSRCACTRSRCANGAKRPASRRTRPWIG